MKKLTLTILLVLSLFITSNVLAQNYKIPLDHPDYEKIEANLLDGLKSETKGLQFSSAFALGEMKSELAINHLIKMLRSHEDDDFRVLAALSLAKIGTERCKFMIRRVGEFIDNPKVSKFCERFLAVEKKSLPAEDEKLITKILKKK